MALVTAHPLNLLVAGGGGVQRELRNQLFQSGRESAGFAGLKWMYDGIDPNNLFN